MSSIKRVGDLDIEQDLDFQQRSWRVQRAGWIAMALVTLLALLGLFGSGPLGNATAGEEGAPLRLEYGRFVRLGAPSHLRVHIGPGTTPNGEAHLWLSRAYLEEIEIQRITPEPDRVEAGPDRLTYIFLVPEA